MYDKIYLEEFTLNWEKSLIFSVSSKYRDVFLREADLDNLCYNYVIERSKYENSYDVHDIKKNKNPLRQINDGAKIVIRRVKIFLRNLIRSIKNFISFTFGGCFDGRSLFTSGCWILPTTFLATGLLARDEICSISNNNFVGKMLWLLWIHNPFNRNIPDNYQSKRNIFQVAQ